MAPSVAVLTGFHCIIACVSNLDGLDLDPGLKSITPGSVLPSDRNVPLDGVAANFPDWIDYNGVTFLNEVLEWGRTFSGFCI